MENICFWLGMAALAYGTAFSIAFLLFGVVDRFRYMPPRGVCWVGFVCGSYGLFAGVLRAVIYLLVGA